VVAFTLQLNASSDETSARQIWRKQSLSFKLAIQTRFWPSGKLSGCSGRNEIKFCENISLPPFPRAGLFLLSVYWQTV
jgi:hypothetical protein